MEEVDVCTMALLADLGALDAGPEGEERTKLLRSAHESASRLQALGGGTLGEQKLDAILAALNAELAS